MSTVRFCIGLVVGWTAARSLPPKPDGVPAWSPPSLRELGILSEAAQQAYAHLKQKAEAVGASASGH